MGHGSGLGVLVVAALSAGCSEILRLDEWGGPPDPAASSASGGGAGGGGAGGLGGDGGAEIGLAIRMNGQNTYVQLGLTDALTPSSGFTWELWFRADRIPASGKVAPARTLLGAVDTAECEDVYLGFGSLRSEEDELTFVVDGLGLCLARDEDPVRHRGFSPDVWYHVAGVADYAQMKVLLYVDGRVVDSRSRAFRALGRALPVDVGRLSDGINSGAYFAGAIDELRVYGFPLPASTIAAHYAAGAGTYGDDAEPNLVSGWHFDEGGGPEVLDYAPGSPLHGDALGAIAWVEGKVAKP